MSPIYPDVAARAMVEGPVLLECEVSPQGRVTDVRVLRGIPLLDQGGSRCRPAVGLLAHAPHDVTADGQRFLFRSGLSRPGSPSWCSWAGSAA